MIYISEKESKKVSGNTSLFLSFLYRQEIIDTIKKSGPCYFDKVTKLWEVPISSLARLLDILTYYDDITLIPQKERETGTHFKPILEYKTKPFVYQLEGIEYGLNHDRWLLLDSPGLGKSLQAIYLAEELSAQKGLKKCLIVCGLSSLRSNWEQEIKKHSRKDCIIIGKNFSSTGRLFWNTIPQRAEQLKKPIKEFFIIINIETLRSNDVIDAIKTGANDIGMIIFDEAHKAKGWSSQQGKNLLKLTEPKYKVAMTGTLLMNSPADAFVPLKWVGAERANVTTYKKQYFVFGGFGGHEVVGYKNLPALKDELESCSLRRTKDLLDLPPKTIINEYVEMSEAHNELYESVKNGIKEECDKINLDKNNLLALTTRLRQATSCPSVLTSKEIMSSKIERCMDLVESIVSHGDKVVIMSTFKEPVYLLQQLLEKYKPLIGTGDQSDEVVYANKDMFQEDDEHMVFIGTTAKIGTGITLHRASYMICIDCPWTAAAQEQVEDRIHRIGTLRPVFIYRLICENSIDIMVAKLLEVKKAISDFIVDNIEDEDTLSILRKYIKEEL